MNLQEKIERVVGRIKSFYRVKTPGHFLIQTEVPTGCKNHDPFDAYDYSRDDEVYRLMDDQFASARAGWEIKQGIDDDEIPCIHPRFGYAEHIAWIGSKVNPQPGTCHPEPFVGDDFDPDTLRVDENNRWFQIMERAYAYLRSKKDGTFVLSVRGSTSPLEMAEMVRGSAILTDLADENREEFLRKLLQRLTDIYPVYYNRLRSWADEVLGGHVMSYFKVWVGPDGIGSLSDDIAQMISKAMYESYGFPYEKALCEQYGSVLYHTHTEKLHFIPKLCTLPNLVLLQFENDPQLPNGVINPERLLQAAGSVKLHLAGSSQEIRQNFSKLAGGNVYLRAWCTDRDDARDLVNMVRRYSRPLDESV